MFVTGSTANSNATIQRFRHFCADRLNNDWVLEVIDLHDDPTAASQHSVFITPTVVMNSAGQSRKLVGDFGDEGALARELGIA